MYSTTDRDRSSIWSTVIAEYSWRSARDQTMLESSPNWGNTLRSSVTLKYQIHFLRHFLTCYPASLYTKIGTHALVHNLALKVKKPHVQVTLQFLHSLSPVILFHCSPSVLTWQDCRWDWVQLVYTEHWFGNSTASRPGQKIWDRSDKKPSYRWGTARRGRASWNLVKFCTNVDDLYLKRSETRLLPIRL